jgi:hypothetical protein
MTKVMGEGEELFILFSPSPLEVAGNRVANAAFASSVGNVPPHLLDQRCRRIHKWGSSSCRVGASMARWGIVKRKNKINKGEGCKQVSKKSAAEGCNFNLVLIFVELERGEGRGGVSWANLGVRCDDLLRTPSNHL